MSKPVSAYEVLIVAEALTQVAKALEKIAIAIRDKQMYPPSGDVGGAGGVSSGRHS